MRTGHFLLIAVTVAVAGGFAVHEYQRRTQSPFAFGQIRAGRLFADIDAESQQYGTGRMSCDSIAGGYQVCRVPTDGPPGTMVAVVNDGGYVVVLDQQVTDTSPKMEALTRGVVESWDSVGTGSAEQQAPDGVVRRWASADQRWSATMVVNRGSKTAKDVMLTDEQALTHMDARALPALLVLARRGLVRETTLDSVEKRLPGALARAADTLAASGRRLAAAAARLPLCAPERTARAGDGDDYGTGTADRFGPLGAVVARQAVAAAFPGQRLVLGDDPLLMDGAGAVQPVLLTAPVPTSDLSIWAFTVSYPGRIAAVREGAEHFDAPPCRAPAEVIVATFDTATSTVTAVRHARLEDDALASRVGESRIVFDADGAPQLAVRWVGEYASSDWFGEVEWLSVLGIDSLRTLGRRPFVVVRTDRQERTTAVRIGEPVFGDESDEDPVSGYSVAGKRVVTAVAKPGDLPRIAQFVMPSPIGGLPSGWLLLPLL